MKKIYKAPALRVSLIEPTTMLAGSKFDIPGSDSQSIIPDDEEYDDEFCVKGNDFFWED